MTRLKLVPRRNVKVTEPDQKYPGRFITFEGVDGSGKSTQVNRLAGVLEHMGIGVVVTREPGGTALGESVRQMLLDVRNKGMHATTELALMFAARAQHVAEVIEPALLRGDWVLCDRFVDSSEAYQGAGRCLGSDLVLALQQLLLHGLSPDLTVMLDHDAAESVARARKRSMEEEGQESRFEDEGERFFERVQQSFVTIAARDKARVFVTNARRPVEAVHNDVVAEVCRRFLTKTRGRPHAGVPGRRIHPQM